MNCDEVNKKSIIDIFNDMDYREKVENINPEGCGDVNPQMEYLNELNQALKITKEPKTFENAVDAAVKAQNKWKNSSALKRANSLHRIWKDLREISKSSSKLKNEISIVADYVDFYSDLTIQTEEYSNWRPQGVTLIVLSNYSPFLILGATVPAALASGCSVIVLAPEKIKIFPLFLEELVAEVGLPEGVLNIVTEYDINDIPVSKKISKVFFCGSYLSAQKLYTKSLAKSFNFICPGNTTALILESCDLDAAVDKIITETWGRNSLFGVSNVIVQESIEKKFLDRLKDRVEKFLNFNINDPKFKDKTVGEKIKKIIFEAVKAGASVEKCNKFEKETEWSPTVIVNYQDQSNDEDVPIIKVSVCRTAKEGVALVNNCRYCLGTSIWSEISSQALEISSMLVSPNVWINCHGEFEAGKPLQASGISGDCVLGGSDGRTPISWKRLTVDLNFITYNVSGVLEFMSFRQDDPVDGTKSGDDKSPDVDKMKVIQVAISAQQAFSVWRNVKSRRKHLKDIATSVEDNKELNKLSEFINSYAHSGNLVNFSEHNSADNFSVIRKKGPIGVILLMITSPSIDIKAITSLIVPAIALGNAVIIVLKEENSSVKMLIKTFSNFLLKNLLNVIVGIKAGIQLASDPNIHAIWMYEESSIPAEFFQMIKTHSARSLKHIWIVPKHFSASHHLFQKECLQNKVVWLTNVDQFP